MKVSYDSEDDILYMHFKDWPAEAVREVEDGVIVELDEKGEVMGIELWGIRKKGGLKQLKQIAVTHQIAPTKQEHGGQSGARHPHVEALIRFGASKDLDERTGRLRAGFPGRNLQGLQGGVCCGNRGGPRVPGL
jgi:uncharacterized protein YuzE